MAKRTYYPAKDMADVAYWNKYIGHHFFDKGTMEFFGSKIESGLYKNNTFLTSDEDAFGANRAYTVRHYNPNNAHIDNISSYRQFKTRVEAKEFALAYKEA